MRNTARVMIELEADVLGVVEAESRPVLAAFNAEIVAALGGEPFRARHGDRRQRRARHRCRPDEPARAFPSASMRSHVDDRMADGEGDVLARLSRVRRGHAPRATGSWSWSTTSRARAMAARRHRTPSARRRPSASGKSTASCWPAEARIWSPSWATSTTRPTATRSQPLLEGTELKDVFEHPGVRRWRLSRHLRPVQRRQQDRLYAAVAEAVRDRVQAGGVFRRAMWPGSRPKRWEAYPGAGRAARMPAPTMRPVWVGPRRLTRTDTDERHGAFPALAVPRTMTSPSIRPLMAPACSNVSAGTYIMSSGAVMAARRTICGGTLCARRNARTFDFVAAIPYRATSPSLSARLVTP